MSEPFLGEVRIFACNFAPYGWAMCNGQILSIAQNSALFSLLGTQYGGNGTTNFALPDLRGRIPTHKGQGLGLSPYDQGEQIGEEAVTLLTTEMPIHSHPLALDTDTGTSTSPSGTLPAVPNINPRFPKQMYSTAAPTVTMLANSLGASGGNQPHNNLMPYLTFNFCIALAGIFPSRN